MIATDPHDQLKSAHDAIADLISPHSDVALFDYPLALNVGDLLITLGTLKFLQRHDLNLVAARNLKNTEESIFRALPVDTVILLQGGGNFGDLYPHIQQYREWVIERFPRNRIVILPQTVHYRDSAELHRSTERLMRHPDLHLFVRDDRSLEVAMKHFGEDRCRLSPDMAHELWPSLRGELDKLGPTPAGTLFFMRTDEEHGQSFGAFETFRSQFVDWDDVVTPGLRALKHTLARLGQVQRLVGVNLTPAGAYFRAMQHEVKKIAARLDRYENWVTSRMHGMILGRLLDKEVTVIDNNYGKLSSYIRTWRRSLGPVRLISSEQEALLAASEAGATRGHHG